MKKAPPSKAEINKNLRRVLAQHRVDITQISFSASGGGVSMSGVLLKSDGTEFSSGGLAQLVEALNSFGYINTDLENWDLTGGAITRKDWSPETA